MIADRVADVVTVEVIRNALNAAADEMGTNLARSAYTPIIYEMKDYSVAIFNDRFQLLGQAPGLPIFLGALEDAVRVTVERYGESQVQPGDVYLINDSYLAGSHIWQEGYRLGPTRIVRRGRVNRELMALLEDNSRLPKSIRGDFLAQMAACHTGEQRLIEVYSRFGRPVVESAVAQIFDQC